MVGGSFSGAADERSVGIVLPDGRSDGCETLPLGDRLEFRFGPVSEAGEYVAKAASPHGQEEQSFMVTPPTSESDLTSLSAAEIRSLQDGVGMEVISNDASRCRRLARREASLWLGGIVLVLVLAVAEMFLFSGWDRGELR